MQPINDRIPVYRTDDDGNKITKSPQLSEEQWKVIIELFKKKYLDDEKSKVSIPSIKK